MNYELKRAVSVGNSPLLSGCIVVWRLELLLVLTQLLHVDGLDHFLAVGDRRLFECLTAAEFLYDSCALEFALEFLEGFLDVLAFFYGYDNHAFVFLFYGFVFVFLGCKRSVHSVRIPFAVAKLLIIRNLTKFFG